MPGKLSKQTYEKPTYGVGRVVIGTSSFSITAKIKEKDKEGNTVSEEQKSWKFDLSILNEIDDIPDGFELVDKAKYAFVISADGQKLFHLRPANVDNVDLDFCGFKRTAEGTYLLKIYDAQDFKTKQPTGKKVIKFYPEFKVVTEDSPAFWFVYPQVLGGVNFSDSRGNPHFARLSDDEWELRGNPEWQGKPTAFFNTFQFVSNLKLFDANVTVPDIDDPNAWLEMLEDAYRSMPMRLTGAELKDGYISDWGFAEPIKKKTKAVQVTPAKPAKKVEEELPEIPFDEDDD